MHKRNYSQKNQHNMEKDDQGILWEVFVQPKPGKPHKHIGSLHAYDKEMAMQSARDLYTRRSEGVGIWLVKAEDIVSSQSSDDEAFFDPSNDKVYRHPTFYKLPDGIKHM
jgi:ring-1,2-phenylacetyl-CoA epoxidase subunit PaaB